MQKLDIHTTQGIDSKLLLYILIDGIEYAARGFWAQLDQYPKTDWYIDEDESIVKPDLDRDATLCLVRDDEDGEADTEDREFVAITLNKLAEATKWALDQYNHLFPHWTYNGPGRVLDDIDYDGVGADVIIQKIVLGEVIYG